MEIKKIKKGQRKKFFQVEVPLITSKIHLYSYALEELIDKVVKIDLTKSLRGKALELKAKVKNDNGKLVGDLLSIQLIQSYIRRMMRRGTDYVEDSFEAECKDSKLRIKLFIITRKKVPRSIRNSIRKNAKKHIAAKIKIRNTKEIFSDTIANKLQKELSQKIKKTYPPALCEIKMIQVIKKLEKKENKDTNKNE